MVFSVHNNQPSRLERGVKSFGSSDLEEME